MPEPNAREQVSMPELLEGSKEEWDAFVECYSRLIYKTFYAPSFGFTREDIDDLFHDFMVMMIKDDYRKLRLYEGRNSCSLASYLRKIAVNLAIDRRKRLNRERSLSLNRPLKAESDEELGDLVEGPGEEPISPLENEEDRLRFLWALYGLDVPKLLVIVLVVYHEVNREKIAEILRTTRQNVDVLFKRGKDRLIDQVGKKKSAKALDMQPLRWSDDVIALRNRLPPLDRDELLATCLERLDVPDELLVALLFINAGILQPTPDRLAVLFKSEPGDEEHRAREILGKLGLE